MTHACVRSFVVFGSCNVSFACKMTLHSGPFRMDISMFQFWVVMDSRSSLCIFEIDCTIWIPLVCANSKRQRGNCLLILLCSLVVCWFSREIAPGDEREDGEIGSESSESEECNSEACVRRTDKQSLRCATKWSWSFQTPKHGHIFLPASALPAMNKNFEIGLLLPANEDSQKDVELVCITSLKLANSKYVDNQHRRHGKCHLQASQLRCTVRQTLMLLMKKHFQLLWPRKQQRVSLMSQVSLRPRLPKRARPSQPARPMRRVTLLQSQIVLDQTCERFKCWPHFGPVYFFPGSLLSLNNYINMRTMAHASDGSCDLELQSWLKCRAVLVW